ncbi:hypothetical protein EDC04DRAFT_2627739 [Pisolithus marmoratus]|nr:hypothetical protein EDC04DRAFT_2627739 [Pisolithus marmoratus]
MIPFVPTVALAFVSSIASAFVVLRIVIPILPPHPLSRRVRPPTRAILWLASLDFLALCVFIWQATTEYFGGPVDVADARDAASSARLWFALTIRQSCLMVVSGLTLLHIRMGRSVSFGAKHWMIWAPTLLLSGAGVPSLFIGLAAYSSATAVLSTVAFGGLVYTLVVIRRNLAAVHEPTDSWPPAKEVEEKPRHSFATEDIDVLREGSSWLTSDAGSHRDEVASNWSFSTYHTHNGRFNPTGSQQTLAPKSSFWFSAPSPQDPRSTSSILSRRLIVPASSPTYVISDDPDPFRRDVPSRPRLGSQSSWLTSSAGTHPTVSAWSFPTAHNVESVVDIRAGLLPHAAPASRPATPAALSTAQVLGGYGYTGDSEKGIASLAAKGSGVDISYSRYAFWLLSIWIPTGLSFLTLSRFLSQVSCPSSQVTLSSPLLAANILLRSPIPIPTGLFDVHGKPPPAAVLRAPSPADTLATYTRDYKRSGSVTIVEGRRSGDVWISQGDAVDGKGKVGRAIGLMSPVPRLAVLPCRRRRKMTGSIRRPCLFRTSLRRKSKASSHLSTGEEAFASRIMIAQRHYSALATTVVVPAVWLSNLQLVLEGTHLRSRSISSVIGQAITTEDPDISPPPSDPLPPTPPNIRNAKLAKQLMHKKSYSSGFSLGAVEDMHQIDALTAGVLPLLVPGLKIKEWEFSPPISSTVAKKPRRGPKESNGSDFGERRRGRKISAHRRNHFSLPSLGLGRDTLQSWKSEVNRALANKIHQYSTLPTNDGARRNTVWGDESVPNLIAHPRVGEDHLRVPTTGASLGRSPSARSLGLRPEVPHNVDSARTSMITLTSDRVVPPSAASTVTLFEPESTFDPDAQSTPYDSQKGYPYSRKYQAAMMAPSNSRRSSIIYIKSSDDENTRPESVTALTTDRSNDVPNSDPAPPVSIRAVRPLIPKSSIKLQRKTTTSSSEAKTNSPGGGLRPLSLLQDRDHNTTQDTGESKVGVSGTRPLLLGKKKSRVKVVQNPDSENVQPASSGNTKHLKPLQLYRSESSRLRGLLRRAEAVPTVVVRPPSDQLGTLYEYR